MHYGDVLTNQDFTAMLKFHRHAPRLATLLVHQRAKSNSVLSLDDQGRIVPLPGAAQRERAARRVGLCIFGRNDPARRNSSTRFRRRAAATFPATSSSAWPARANCSPSP